MQEKTWLDKMHLTRPIQLICMHRVLFIIRDRIDPSESVNQNP